MENFMRQAWFWQAFFAAMLFVPSVLAIPFFKKNFHYPSDAFVAWYFLGSTIMLFAMPVLNGSLKLHEMEFGYCALGAMCFGLVFNALANNLLFRAYALAPNPALPEAIVDSKGVMVFLAALTLASIFPSYFDSEKFNWKSALGILLVTAGVMLIALRDSQEVRK